MSKQIFLLLIIHTFSSLFALEISINSAREDHQKYALLHLTNTNKFLCEEIKDDFEQVTQVICAFTKKPEEKIKTIQNDFFIINSYIKKKIFFLLVKPYKKIKLVPVVFNLQEQNSVYQPKVKLSKHWVIIGYENKLPLINNKKKPDSIINFPFYSEENKLPFVGSLDIKGNPVYIKKIEDVTDYLKIKKYFKAKKYDQIIELIDETLDAYPNTLFKAELLYYKIKVYSKLKDYDNVLEISKTYLREYSWDENIPEVLSLTAKAYSSIGMNIDADYFFDRLFNEYTDSIYTQWGYVYKGEMLEESGGTKVAIKYYKKALNETSVLDIGIDAAYHLAHLFIKSSHEESEKYIRKIVKAQPSYFMHDFKSSQDMMYKFADSENYITAASIAKAMSDTMNKSNDDYERLLKDRALWLAKTENKAEALSAINKYIKEYPDGDFIEAIEVVKDELFFDTDDSNTSAKLTIYNSLIINYENDTIGNRAIYEKAKLLLSINDYEKVLEMKPELLDLDADKYNDIERMINSAAVGTMTEALKQKKCHEVLQISNEYNITLSNKWDDGLYVCSMKGADYQMAKNIANKHLRIQDLSLRKKWLFRYIKVDFQTGNYSDVLDASKDLIALIDNDKESKYKTVYRTVFDTYQRLEQKDNMLKAILKLQKIFGVDYIDLDRYLAVMRIGNERKDDNIVIKYGLLAMQIQTKSNSHPQSPYLEFTLYQAYINQENFTKALQTIKILDSVDIEKTNRARQKYLLGTVYTKLWRDEDANRAFDDAIEADKESAWAKLAQSAKDI